jgi:hypothetical protein
VPVQGLLNSPILFSAAKEDSRAFAVGHLALGYLLGTFSARLLKTKINIPIALALSIIPDVDILFESLHIPFIMHRGPVHSIITALVIFLPFFLIYRARAIPYFLALVQHFLIGDYLTGGSQLLWPVSSQLYGIGLQITSRTNIIIEWIAFSISTVAMIKTKDIHKFFQAHATNVLLAIPTFTVLLPALLGFPLNVPLWLIPPHLFYVVLFSASIAITLTERQTRPNAKG